MFEPNPRARRGRRGEGLGFGRPLRHSARLEIAPRSRLLIGAVSDDFGLDLRLGVMAERLRDLSQPIDVPLLDATVAAFYGTGSKEEVCLLTCD